ncbi:transglycosylase SLT domain-containing protein [Aestuariivirga sp.]|uniref:transglycosylase SLT domain-containing protein n=1 Tax=Aestuariivirga sp. TaxID=2650926 RepID=UPI00301653F6
MTKALRCGLLLMGVLFEATATAAARTNNICEREMISAAVTEGVPLGVLYAVAMTESGRKGMLHPYALNIEGRTVFASSKREALLEFARARDSGKVLIDLGCMQINHHYHGQEFSSVDAMLEPATNVRYAARFLRDLRHREGSWAMAVARYHAGPNNNPAQKRYICAVIRNLVTTGFGGWTPQARQFCR